MALPTLASLTPPDVNVTIVDEEIEPIDFDFKADLIGITAMTCKAKRAYQIAAEFRKRGRHVIMGGIHASMLPEEALQHVDTVVSGEAEGIWGEVIEDFKNKKIKNLYKSENFADLNTTPIPRRNLVKNNAYSYHMMQTTRGCPFKCTFCSVQKFNGRNVRLAGAEKARLEIEQLLKYCKSNIELSDKTGKTYQGILNLFITDDNFTINRDHAVEICSLIEEMSGKYKVKINWMTHADIGVAKDDDLLAILSKTGCTRLFIGFESLENDNLNLVKKKARKSEEYSDAIAKIYSYGIDIVASFIVGNDFDDAESIKKIHAFANENHLYDILVSILTPYPGTDLFFQMEKENRILSKNWNNYDFGNVVFKPQKLTRNELLKLQNQLFLNIFAIKSLSSKLILREKKYFKNQNKFLTPKSNNKYLIAFLLLLKSSKILKDSGFSLKDILVVIFYALKYVYHTDKKLSTQTVSGLIHFIDKVHYIRWKMEYDNSRSMVLGSEA